jgi:DNA-binding CsgD family transcriptional regulator
VSRGPFHFVQVGGFSGLGRIILDKLDRGVVLLDRRDSIAADRIVPLAARVKRSSGASYRVVVTPVPRDADEQRDISTDVLRELYALTPAQAQVARSLFAGRSVEESAAALNLSLNTVRTHLKQIFTRCEVQSQAELLHLLAQGPQHL